LVLTTRGGDLDWHIGRQRPDRRRAGSFQSSSAAGIVMSCRHPNCVNRSVAVGIIARFALVGILLAAGSPALAQANQSAPASGLSGDACPGDNGGITLPRGFCATVFADNIGHARHLVVSPSGIVYVNTWSGRYYGNDRPPPGGFLVALQDTKGDGHA